jgi:hypothetical protein
LIAEGIVRSLRSMVTVRALSDSSTRISISQTFPKASVTLPSDALSKWKLGGVLRSSICPKSTFPTPLPMF